MSHAVAEEISTLLPTIETALVDWLPTQRWFGGKDRQVATVRLAIAAEFTADRTARRDPRGILAIADVRFTGSAVSERYQLPLGLHHEPPAGEHTVITRIGGLAIYDATDDHELTAELLRLICRNQVRGSTRFRAEASGELAFAHRNDLRSRRNSTEQSNTSIIFGDRFILKLFRRLPNGLNPDLEAHRALGRSASSQVAPLLGAIETEIGNVEATLGVLHSFISDSTDGWQLATADVLDTLRGVPKAAGFAEQARTLGGAVAAVHRDLAREFGTATMSLTDLASLQQALLRKLDAAVVAVPALKPYEAALRTMLRTVGTGSPGSRIQRVHGDLHLGQVLRTHDRWLILDFEGEPALPIADRIAWQSPLRDVAGMLRSFDYAAHHLLHTGDASTFDPDACARAEQWATRARDAFCTGYAEAAGIDPRVHIELLRGYELDKMVYETVYETRNRPGWARIPLRALRRLIDPA
jgi:maltokinase